MHSLLELHCDLSALCPSMVSVGEARSKRYVTFFRNLIQERRKVHPFPNFALNPIVVSESAV